MTVTSRFISSRLQHIAAVLAACLATPTSAAVTPQITRNVQFPFVELNDDDEVASQLISNPSFETYPAVQQCLSIDQRGATQPWVSRTGGVRVCRRNTIASLEGQQNLFIDLGNEVYQEIRTIPGTWFEWEATLASVGNNARVDVVISGGEDDARVNTAVFRVENLQRRWVTARGRYRVPAGQTVTRFSFDRRTSGGTDASVRVDVVKVKQKTRTNTCGQHVNIFPYNPYNRVNPRRTLTIENMNLDRELPTTDRPWKENRDVSYVLAAYFERAPGDALQPDGTDANQVPTTLVSGVMDSATRNKVSDFVYSFMDDFDESFSNTAAMSDNGVLLNLTAAASSVVIDVYNTVGTVVRRWDVGAQSGGKTYLTFDGKDQNGGMLPFGRYTFLVRASQGGNQVHGYVAPRMPNNIHDLAGWTQFYAEYGCYLNANARERLTRYLNNDWDANDGWTTANFRTLRHSSRAVAGSLIETEQTPGEPDRLDDQYTATVQNALFSASGIINKNLTLGGHDEWSSIEYGTQNFAPLYMMARFLRDPDEATAAYVSFQDALQRYVGHWFNGYKMSFSSRDGSQRMQSERASVGGTLWYHLGGIGAPGDRVAANGITARSWAGDAVGLSQKWTPSIGLELLLKYVNTMNVDTYSQTNEFFQHSAMRKTWGMFAAEAVSRATAQTTQPYIVYVNPDGETGGFIQVGSGTNCVGDQAAWTCRDVHIYDDSMAVMSKRSETVSFSSGTLDVSCATVVCQGYQGQYVATWRSPGDRLFAEVRSTVPMNVNTAGTLLTTGTWRDSANVQRTDFAMKVEVASAGEFAGATADAKLAAFKRAVLSKKINYTATATPSMSYSTRRNTAASFAFQNVPVGNSGGSVSTFPYYTVNEKMTQGTRILAYQEEKLRPFYVRYNLATVGEYILSDTAPHEVATSTPPDARTVHHPDEFGH